MPNIPKKEDRKENIWDNADMENGMLDDDLLRCIYLDTTDRMSSKNTAKGKPVRDIIRTGRRDNNPFAHKFR